VLGKELRPLAVIQNPPFSSPLGGRLLQLLRQSTSKLAEGLAATHDGLFCRITLPLALNLFDVGMIAVLLGVAVGPFQDVTFQITPPLLSRGPPCQMPERWYKRFSFALPALACVPHQLPQ